MTIEDVTPETLRGPTDEERSQQIESMNSENTALRDALAIAKGDLSRALEREEKLRRFVDIEADDFEAQGYSHDASRFREVLEELSP